MYKVLIPTLAQVIILYNIKNRKASQWFFLKQCNIYVSNKMIYAIVNLTDNDLTLWKCS